MKVDLRRKKIDEGCPLKSLHSFQTIHDLHLDANEVLFCNDCGIALHSKRRNEKLRKAYVIVPSSRAESIDRIVCFNCLPEGTETDDNFSIRPYFNEDRMKKLKAGVEKNARNQR